MAEVSDGKTAKRARELFDKGLIAMERNNLPYAIEMFSTALALDPKSVKARQFLRAAEVKQYVASGKSITSHLTSTIVGLPLLIKGWIEFKTGKIMEAIATSEKLLRTDPLNIQFVNLFVKAALAANMQEVAIHTLSAIREYYADNVSLLMQLGKLYMEADKIAEAKECIEKVVDLRPNDADAQNLLKNVLARETMVRGGWDEASAKDSKDSYRKVIKDEKEATLLEAQSKAVKAEHSLDLLIADTEARLRAEPENLNYRRSLATYYSQIDKYEEALRVLEEAKRYTGGADPQIDQLIANIRLKQFDFEIAQCKENGDTEGVKRKEAEKEEFHLKDLATRTERYPNDLNLKFEYGVLLYQSGRYNEAIQQLQQASRSARVKVKSLYYLGLCFYQKQQFDLAKEQLEKAASEIAEMDDTKKEIYYMLGNILEKAGDMKNAIEYYKEIYQVDIAYKDVASKIEQAYSSK